MFNTYMYLFGRSSCSASKLQASNNMGLCENVIVDGSTEIFWLLADSFDWHSWMKFVRYRAYQKGKIDRSKTHFRYLCNEKTTNIKRV